ncbi:MAG: aminotransferase class III-fold pyridoxal phosphate-dependent enzyme [Lewinellaceae bacterium]|nr:aminotransferase class III-fold pyridoxal phosphate-dependent enzyme [Saprospiraceae bacterium]MCB9343479.1 aminotransferase class III-fold pyridoxal phosphate-dependent enzyme [Lewinellaceae bacterium]
MDLFDVYPLQPVKIVRGQGSWVWNDRGDRYLDMYGGHAVISIGHSHPHWVDRIENQLRQLAFYSNSVELPLQQELAKMLGEMSGLPDYHLFLCNSGAEANENALKLASFYNRRRKVLAFEKGFHGRTSLAVSVTDNPAIVAPVNQGHEVVFAPFNDVEALNSLFKEHEFTAVIVEGIQGVGGIRIAETEFLQALRRHCDQSDTVLIGDSVQCGYGRSGRFFSHDFSGIQADIYTVAKGMGNGFPIGGVLIGPQFQAKHGMLGTTFGGNPLACAAALGVLEVMEKENLIEHVAQTGAYLMEELGRMPELQNLRGRGLMIGFDVPESHKNLKKVLLEKEKVFTGEAKGGVIRLLPALNVSREEADVFLEKLQNALKSC